MEKEEGGREGCLTFLKMAMASSWLISSGAFSTSETGREDGREGGREGGRASSNLLKDGHGVVLVDFFLRFLHERDHVTHAQDTAGHSVRVELGREGGREGGRVGESERRQGGQTR